jgi:glucose/arabinose dehydrogenase
MLQQKAFACRVEIVHGKDDVIDPQHVGNISRRPVYGERVSRLRILSAAVLLGGTVACGSLDARHATFEPQTYVTGLSFPTNMAFAPDGRLFVTEKETGDVRVISADGVLLPEPFASFGVQGGGETGLLGIALDPRFDRGEPWVYLYLSDATIDRNVLVRVRADGDVGGRQQQLLLGLPIAGVYHNGGELLFGPDGKLYVAVGEGHDATRAQDLGSIGGKILRLNPDGTVPDDDPFGAGNPAFVSGIRNSFGLCAMPDGRILETENGPDVDDEVNVLRAGANYGWPAVTGVGHDARFVDPVVVFPRTVALTGCAAWNGGLYVGSFNDGLVRAIDPGTGSAEIAARLSSGVTDLAVGPDGRLYVATADGISTLGTATG